MELFLVCVFSFGITSMTKRFASEWMAFSVKDGGPSPSGRGGALMSALELTPELTRYISLFSCGASGTGEVPVSIL